MVGVKRIEKLIGNESFFLTYGDGVADIDIRELMMEHRSNSGVITMTSVQPDG